MKSKITALTLAIMAMLCLKTSAQDKIPHKLHGYWLFDSGGKGNWDEILVGENYVELLWDLYKVDSLREQGDQYDLWLSNKKKGSISLHVEQQADGLATFKFNKLDFPITAKLSQSHPDIQYYTTAEMQAKLPGEWMVPGELSKVFSLKGNKMQLDGKEWEVTWFGEYLKREYRALIRANGNYRLVFFKKRGQAINIGGDGQDVDYSKKPKYPELFKILGNWYEPIANQWKFGFFENFAVYKGKFWDYTKLNFQHDQGVIVLTAKNETVSLSVNKHQDNTISIRVGKQPAVRYKLAGNRLPDFSTKEEGIVKDTHFMRVDTTYITGYLRNAPNQQPFSISYNDPLTDKEETVYGELDSLGRFELKIPLFNTTQVFLDWRRTNKIDVIQPGERYFIYYDNRQYLFMGENVRLHTELSQYTPYGAFPYNKEGYAHLEKLNGLAYLEGQKERLQKANEYTREHFVKHPTSSAKLRYFVENFNRYNVARDLMQKRFKLDRQNDERFPAEYMAYVRDSAFKQQLSPFTLIRDFSTFIRDYVDYEKEGAKADRVSVNHSEVRLRMVQANKITASLPEKEAVRLEWQADSLLSIDSVKSKEIAARITPEQRTLARNLTARNETEIANAAVNLLWERILEEEVAFYEKTVPYPDILRIQISKLLYQYMERTRKPLPPAEFKKYISKIQVPALLASVVAYQNHLLEVPKIDFAYAASLKNTAHLKESKDADSIFKALVEPYKGKVIYLDFWGTWCQPCREEMKFASAAKDALKGKDVVFMYFANNSPEESWKNIIREMGLTSENTVHYRLPAEQQSLIERRLAVKGFPTYLLIDKEGNIVNTTPPRPSNKDALVAAVNDLLK